MLATAKKSDSYPQIDCPPRYLMSSSENLLSLSSLAAVVESGRGQVSCPDCMDLLEKVSEDKVQHALHDDAEPGDNTNFTPLAGRTRSA
jgi:hypothetical protein